MFTKIVAVFLALVASMVPLAKAQEEECGTPGWRDFLLIYPLENLGDLGTPCVVGSSSAGWDITLVVTLANQTSARNQWPIAIEARVGGWHYLFY